jgi:tetratricopeptide (TPR) repeat protein
MLATLAAFWPALHGGFLNWDDSVNFLDNPNYRGLDWRHLRWMFTAFHLGNYLPLGWLISGLDYALWGMQPLGYHLTSLVFHMLNAVLFYFVAARLLRLGWQDVQQTDDAALSLAAAFAALLFALHPLRVESVAWLSAQHDLLAGSFYLLAVLCYLRAGEDRERRPWLACCAVMFVCSLLSKINALTFPFTLLILDLYPLRRLPGQARQWLLPQYRRIWLEKVPFLAAAVAAGAVGVMARNPTAMLKSVAHYGVGFRIQQSFYGLALYLAKTAVPVRLMPCNPIPADLRLAPAMVLASIGLVLALSAALLHWRRRWPAGLAAWAYYIVTLLPVLGLVHFSDQIAADRYTYLSCMAWAVLGGAAALVGLRRLAPPSRGLLAAGLGAVLFALGALTWRQAKFWRDSETLYRHALAIDPAIAEAHNNLGRVLADQGRTAEAVAEYQRALAVKPDSTGAYNNLGLALADQGKLTAAMAEYRQALKIDPNDVLAHNNMGLTLAGQGKVAAAMAEYRQALKIDPNYAAAHNNLGSVLAHDGKLTEAIAEYRQALKIKPDYAETHNNLGFALAGQGKVAEAIAEYEQALKLNANYAETHNNLGLAFAGQGKSAEAIAEYRQVLKINPNDARAHNNLGLALAGEGKSAEAMAEYRQALRINPNYAVARHNLGLAVAGFAAAHSKLGLALARGGKLAEAAAEFRQAIRINPNDASAHNNLGAALSGQGKTAEAIAEFRRALKIDPNYAQAAHNLRSASGAR